MNLKTVLFLKTYFVEIFRWCALNLYSSYLGSHIAVCESPLCFTYKVYFLSVCKEEVYAVGRELGKYIKV